MIGLQADEVLSFWFDTLKPAQWWRKSAALDEQIEAQFGALLQQARACELSHWRQTASGCLAEILLLDQFSRNVHRDRPDAFAADPQALVLAQSAVVDGSDLGMSRSQRHFLYMPFMHSESRLIQVHSLALYKNLADLDVLRSAQRHHDIIQRFGRYPHRNAILGRQSTIEEEQFLAQPGSRF